MHRSDMPMRTRLAIVSIAFASIGLVALVEGRSSAYIAFALFYVVPIAVASWFGGRVIGFLAAAASALGGLAADTSTIVAQPRYAYINLGTRLALFMIVAWAFSRLHAALREERELARRQAALADQEREIRKVQHALMRGVVEGSRGPLSEIRAKVVDFGFDGDKLSALDARELLHDLAEASVKVSRLIQTLETDGSREARSRAS